MKNVYSGPESPPKNMWDKECDHSYDYEKAPTKFPNPMKCSVFCGPANLIAYHTKGPEKKTCKCYLNNITECETADVKGANLYRVL